MKLLRRPVVILGRSVPLGLVLSAVLVVGALAWTVFLIATFSFTGTAGVSPEPVYAWGPPDFFQDAATLGDNSGIYTKNPLDPQQGVSGNVTGITDEGVSYVGVMFRNLDTVALYVCADLSAVPSWAQVAKTAGSGGGIPNYGPLAPGSATEVALHIFHAGLTPSQDMALDIPFVIQKTACP